MQNRKIIPDIQIARPQVDLQLMRIPAQNLLQLRVRRPRGLERVKGGDDRAGEVRMPADALHLRGAGVHAHGRVHGLLVERGVVVMDHAAHRHGSREQRLEQMGVFVEQGVERLHAGDEGVFALAFEPVPALDLDRVLVVRVVDVGQQDLAGVVVRQPGGSLGVFFVVRGHVEGFLAAAPGVLEDGAEDLFEHLGH